MRLGIAGINGRMGQALKTYIEARDDLQLFSSNDAHELFANSDAVIDFTAPGYSLRLAEIAAASKKPHIIGTTGFDKKEEDEIKKFAKTAPIVWSYNMSIGVNIVAALVEQAAKCLNDDFDIEILEMHHRMKKDSPSGTALMLAEAAASGRGVSLSEKLAFYARGLIGERKRGDIGMAVRRGGGVVGEHTVSFASDNEIIDITHRSFSREIYASGAVKAAKWAAGKPAGLYSMRDVLEL